MSNVFDVPDESVPRPSRPAPPRPVPAGAGDDLPLFAYIAMAVLAGIAIVAGLSWGIPRAIGWAQYQDWSWLAQWVATITTPVHTYLADHPTGHLPTATVYTIWQATGLGALITAWAVGGTGPRLTWFCHGTVTVWIVWSATPDPGRPTAVGLTVLAWTILSTLALRGLSLRPAITIH